MAELLLFLIIIIVPCGALFTWGFLKYKKACEILTEGFQEKEIFEGDDFYDYLEEYDHSLNFLGIFRMHGILYLVLKKLYKEGIISPLITPEKKTQFFSDDEYKFFIKNIWRSNAQVDFKEKLERVEIFLD